MAEVLVMNEKTTKRVIFFSIFLTHVKRLGIVRTMLGGGLMYLSIFEFMFIHFTGVLFFYKFMFRLFYKPKKFFTRDYIVFDRHKINGMNWFDKFNCLFCAYANGTTKLWNDMLDEMSQIKFGKNIVKHFVVFLFSVPLIIFLVFNYLFSAVLFSVIAFFLKYKCTSGKEASAKLKEAKYGESLPLYFRSVLFFTKKYSYVLERNLNQIESSWCPIKHIDREGMVMPEHHKKFIDRDDLKKLQDSLTAEGTLSDIRK